MEFKRAASVCLIHVASRSVLIGQRLVGPWPGYWAFPGGGLEPGEEALAAALRELREETGIALIDARPLFSTDVQVEAQQRRYAITNFAIDVSHQLPALASPELAPHWVALQDLGNLSPIAEGTAAVISRVASFLGN